MLVETKTDEDTRANRIFVITNIKQLEWRMAGGGGADEMGGHMVISPLNFYRRHHFLKSGRSTSNSRFVCRKHEGTSIIIPSSKVAAGGIITTKYHCTVYFTLTI